MRIAMAAVWALAWSAGCTQAASESKSRSKLTRQQFEDVVFDLEGSAPVGRPAVLEKHRTNAAEVRDFVSKNAADPAALSATFDSIEARVDRAHPAK